jgi:tRNA(Ile)-lysidine synthase
MALLHLLCDLKDRYEIELHAAHFDHGVRSSSGDEAKRVRGWSMAAGVACEVGRAGGLNHSQAALRDARYRYLRATARRLGANRIALAHHADDQIETILFRLGRGTGLRGIAGIPPRRGEFVRPLLPFRRRDLQSYVAAQNIPHLNDPSNDDRRYARPRIRHDLCPTVVGPRDGMAGVLLGLAADARLADKGLDLHAAQVSEAVLEDADESSNGLQIARSKLGSYDRAEQARVLRLLARRLGGELTRGGTRLGVEFIKRGRSGRGAQIAEGLELRREFDRLLLRRPAQAEADADLRIDEVDGRGSIMLGGRAYEVTWGSDVDGGDWVARLPLEEVRFPLRLRGPRPGDRIRTRAGSRKLKKLFNEGRVPRSARASVPVLVAADGHICWVAGLFDAGLAIGVGGEEGFVIGVSDLRSSA